MVPCGVEMINDNIIHILHFDKKVTMLNNINSDIQHYIKSNRHRIIFREPIQNQLYPYIVFYKIKAFLNLN